ncbi:MAG: Ig-like domain-containing protein [Planctomycetes bacterium]|nr:Ig-like domain-containing protein [Planctomycetota bacterium]MCB9917807.1 Ig-like domain-containing protein [Planctomycetota bacterium]
MGKQLWIGLAVCGAIALAGCGGAGNGDIAGGNAAGEVGELRLLGHDPDADALQVDVDVEVTLRFDAAIDPTALVTQEMALCVDGETTPIDGTFRVSNGGRTIHFKPTSPLEEATTYRFTLEPTLCDQSYRTLDDSPSFAFRTTDTIAPKLLESSVTDRQVDVSRIAPIAFRFDEELDTTSIRSGSITLRDEWGSDYPLELTYADKIVYARCIHDLPGAKSLVMAVRTGNGAIKDRSGNEFAAATVLRFSTASDGTSPALSASFPTSEATDISPNARIELRFNESMDPNSYEPSSLRLVDDFENAVPVTVDLSRDLRTVRLTPRAPLAVNDNYRVRALVGASALADVSGNPIVSPVDFTFHTGSDTTPPKVTRTLPADDETSVPIGVPLEIYFDKAIDVASVRRDTVLLFAANESRAVTLSASGSSIFVYAVEELPFGATCRLEVVGGPDGVRDVHGNVLGTSAIVGFETTTVDNVPKLIVTPGDGASAVPVTSRIVMQSATSIRPESVNDSAIEVWNGLTARIAGSLAVVRGGRAIVFEPTYSLPTLGIVRVVIAGGLGGIRMVDGGAFADDLDLSFRTGGHADTIAPQIELTLNDVAKSRREGLAVPPFGFTIDLKGYDLGSTTVDPTTLEYVLTGAAATPSSDELYAMTSFSGNLRARTKLPASNALANGAYTLTARIQDTSGNVSNLATLAFEVDSSTVERRPFERTQLVWAMFDSDREGGGKGNGRADFEEDLLDFGLIAAGDPIGSNAKMIELVRDGAIGVANKLFCRNATSGRVDEDSVRLRLVTRQPCGAPHMRMAVGGLDPTGNPKRTYGEESTGVLGRALFDYRNSVINENNTGTNPGLGVFVRELFLYQSRLYLDLYPHYVTRFGRTYRELSPHMGGTPVGMHAHDAQVLADTFVYATATPEERARLDTILTAADNLARAIGVILAHEIGHSIGLVPEGVPSSGLHGDRTLHNATTGIEDVMSAILGYESLTTVEFSFRPLNLAYLRERILLK